ncbi:MAG: anaerobic ribonucleoside-triphosphate reductase activating protein [Desulfurococcaceae archaeon]
MSKKLLVAGWKNVSLIDVLGHPSFTLWTCLCNLKCPFCHNWRIANGDTSICKHVEVEKIIEELEASRILIDYLHVTGGEPLIQFIEISDLFMETGELSIKRSLNSNLTLPKQLKYLVEKNLVDHVATDLKIPPIELFGLSREATLILWRNFLESLKIIKDHDIPLELRVPLHKKLTVAVFSVHLDEVLSNLNTSTTTILLNPLLGEPLTNPRNPDWCRENCGAQEEVLNNIVDLLRSKGFSRIVVKSIPGFQKS